MIPSDFIDDLLAKTDIVDIIDERRRSPSARANSSTTASAAARTAAR